MPTLPSLRCPGCGRTMDQITADIIPPAVKYEDCLRQCSRCMIGATNARNPAKVKYIQGDKPQEIPPATP